MVGVLNRVVESRWRGGVARPCATCADERREISRRTATENESEEKTAR